jgi:hypothetical protein
MAFGRSARTGLLMDRYGTKLLLAALPVASTVTSFLTAAGYLSFKIHEVLLWAGRSMKRNSSSISSNTCRMHVWMLGPGCTEYRIMFHVSTDERMWEPADELAVIRPDIRNCRLKYF